MILCSNPSEQFKSHQSEIEKAINSVLHSNTYVLGEQVDKLESEFAEYIGTSSAIGVANGTDAIEIALRSLKIGFGDEVITVSHTAVATVAAIEATGANAILVDVDSSSYTLNPDQLHLCLSKKTKAVIAVHLYGNSSDLDSILSFCKENNLFLIEDVSQAHGAKFNTKRLGSIGDLGCFSCYPTKNLGAIGDAGLITTNNPELAKKIRMIREYGWKDRISMFAGRNSRLDELQAAVLRVKLKYLDSDNQKRRDLANFYYEKLSKFPISLPKICSNVEPVFHLFVIQVENQNKLIDYLREGGVMASIHYPLPIHLQPGYKDRIVNSKDMKVTENIVNKIVSLPIYPELAMIDAKKVTNLIAEFYN